MIKTIRTDEVFSAVEVPLRDWKFITIHHTVHDVVVPTRHYGKIIDEDHRSGLRPGYPKFRNGMGYHFLINFDGTIEIGDRWIKQIYGAHNRTAKKSYNRISIGIAFVGNFSTSGSWPTIAQQSSYDFIKSSFPQLKAYPHNAFKATECPGKNINLPAWFKIFDNKFI